MPDASPWLAADTPPADLTAFCHRHGLLGETTRVRRAEPAGDGNMNLTLRLHLEGGGDNGRPTTAILKQSRPWVQKYPQIEAPAERIVVEADFYRAAAGTAGVGELMPSLMARADAAHALLLADLGPSSDLTGCYQGRAIAADVLQRLAEWLAALHRRRGDAAGDTRFRNRAMRDLNHQHIFVLPMDPATDLPLDDLEPGLAAAADELRADAAAARMIAEAGERYLADGDTLLHGDFYPGSWLGTQNGPRVIDPEFAFCGEAEFDVGVALAHLTLSGGDAADHFQHAYTEAAGEPVDTQLLERFRCIEVIRRLIGVAQLPLPEPIPGGTRRADHLRRAHAGLIQTADA